MTSKSLTFLSEFQTESSQHYLETSSASEEGEHQLVMLVIGRDLSHKRICHLDSICNCGKSPNFAR